MDSFLVGGDEVRAAQDEFYIRSTFKGTYNLFMDKLLMGWGSLVVRCGEEAGVLVAGCWWADVQVRSH